MHGKEKKLGKNKTENYKGGAGQRSDLSKKPTTRRPPPEGPMAPQGHFFPGLPPCPPRFKASFRSPPPQVPPGLSRGSNKGGKSLTAGLSRRESKSFFVVFARKVPLTAGSALFVQSLSRQAQSISHGRLSRQFGSHGRMQISHGRTLEAESKAAWQGMGRLGNPRLNSGGPGRPLAVCSYTPQPSGFRQHVFFGKQNVSSMKHLSATPQA